MNREYKVILLGNEFCNQYTVVHADAELPRKQQMCVYTATNTKITAIMTLKSMI